MFSSSSSSFSSNVSSNSSGSASTSNATSTSAIQNLGKRVVYITNEEVEKKLASILSQVQQNQISSINLTPMAFGEQKNNRALASSSGLGSGGSSVQLLDYSSFSCLSTLSGHSSFVYALAVLPNGSLASGSGYPENTIKLWDSSSGHCLSTLTGHSSSVNALSALPNASLASGSVDNTIKLWDSSSGRCLSTLKGHSNSVLALAVLSNGSLASGSVDNTIKLWDSSSGRCLSTLKGHSNSVWALAVLPNGSLASGSWDKTIKLWDTASGRCLSTLTGHSDAVRALAVLPNGTLASGSQDHTIKLWDTSSGRCLSTLTGHSSSVSALAVLPNGSLASASYDKTIKLWDSSSGRCLSTLTRHSSPVYALAALPNSSLASGSYDHTIKLWEPKAKAFSLVAQQVQTVLNILKSNTSVTSLNLSGHRDISDDIIDPLIAIFEKPGFFSSRQQNATLKTIDLRNTGVTKKGIEKLQQAIQAQSLSVTILSDGVKEEKLQDQAAKEKTEAEQKRIADQQRLAQEQKKKETEEKKAAEEKRQKVQQEKEKLEKEQKEPKDQKEQKLVPNEPARNEGALKNYDQSLKEHPNDPVLLAERGHMLRALGRNEAALESYDQSLKLRPNDADTQKGRESVLRNLSQELPTLAQSLKTKAIPTVTLSALQVWDCSSSPQNPKKRNLTAQDLLPLLKALETNTSVTYLDLSHNPHLKDEVISLLISLFVPGTFSFRNPNTTLKKIDLRNTRITLAGMDALQDAIQKAKLDVEVLSDWQYVISPRYLKYDEKDEKSRLGVGGFGAVYKATYRNRPVALKKSYVERPGKEQKEDKQFEVFEKDFKNEVTIMERLNDPHVVKFYGYCTSPYYGLVMELMSCSLYDLLHNGKTLKWSLRYQIAQDILEGLQYLHSQPEAIVHRDLKSKNVLLNIQSNDQMRAKLTDFGLSKIKKPDRANVSSVASNKMVGTVGWMAPELIKEDNPRYTVQSDMYSYGMILWELLTQKVPYEKEANDFIVVRRLLKGKREEIPEESKKSHPDFTALIEHCLKASPHERPTAKEAMTLLKQAIENDAKLNIS